MSGSIVERYQRILRADPASRVFIELARALIERGEPEQAVETCARGVKHHPDSVIARIVWGRALLAIGRPEEALARFDEATEIDPSSPYAYDLAGEALVLGGFSGRAVPLLERGVRQHPRDSRIQLWLYRAMEIAAQGRPEPVPGERAATQPLPSAPPVPPMRPARVVAEAPPLPTPPRLDVAEPSTTAPVAVEDDWSSLVASLGLEETPAELFTSAAPPAPAAVQPTPVTESSALADTGALGREAARLYEQAAAPERFGLLASSSQTLDPGLAAEVVDLPPHESPAPQGAQEEPKSAHQSPQLPLTQRALRFGRRHLRAILLVVLVLACAVAAVAYVVMRTQQRATAARVATATAAAGLAHDTLGSLRQASRALNDARALAPRDGDATALLAEVSALLAHDFGDGDAKGAARGALSAAVAGRGTYATRWLVASDAERGEAVRPLLAEREATPLASTIAGQVLLSLGDLEGARAVLERAAQAKPPMLRAIALLGDLDLSAGDLATAQERYQAVLRAQPHHPRAALGLADVNLAAGLDLPDTLKLLEAVAGDRESTVPLQERLRFDLTLARLLAANGRASEALPILDRAAERYPRSADVVGTRALVLAASGELDGAMAAAKAALEQSGDARHRELVARLQLRQGRYRDLLATSDREPTGTLRTCRAMARLSLGDIPGARTELEAAQRDGKLSPEAAAWAALVEIAAGRTGPVTQAVDAMVEQRIPHPAALLARGRLDAAGGRRESAEHHLREAMGRDPDLIDARVALGELLLGANRAPEALELLNATVARSPWHGGGRVALARALVANGQPREAVGELAAVLANAPEDPPAEAAARQLLHALGRARTRAR